MPNSQPSSNEEQKVLQHEVFGKSAVYFRTFVGVIACLTVCFNSSIYAWTIHESVGTGGEWPGFWELAVMAIGPVAVALNFTNADKTIALLMKVQPISDMLRNKAADIIRKDPV